MGNFKLLLGSIKARQFKLGNKDVKLYLGNTLLYPKPISSASVTCASINYDGAAHVAQSIVVTLNGEVLELNKDYIVTKNDSVTNAGSYTITVSGVNYFNGSANGTFTINKASGNVSTKPTAKSLTYNGNAQALVNAGSGTGTMLYKLGSGSWGTSVPTATNATSYTVYYKASASTNYNESASGSVACSIAKVTPTVTIPKACGLTYNGNAQNLVSGGSTNWGTLQYSTTSGGTYSTSVPQGTNAGSYDVWYKVVGNSNINNVATAKVACLIGKANPAYTAPTKRNFTYNGNAQNLLNTGSTSHGTFKYSTDNSTWGTSIPTATNVGTYAVYWKLDGDSNHNNVSSTKIDSITVSKVTPTVTVPTAKVLTFNNENQVLANAGSTNFGTIQYCLNNSGGTYSTSVPSASAANVTYKVWYKVVGNSNVNDVSPASIDCSIAEKRVTTPTITLSQSSYTYSGNQCMPTPTVKDGSTVIPSSEYTVTYSNNTNAGTATVTISDNTAGNYYISGTTTFTINKVTPTVTAPKACGLTYNGNPQTLVSGGSTNWGTLKYSTTSGGTYSTTIPQGTNAGSYEVWYRVDGDSNINNVAAAKVACSISKANGTATVNGTSNTYNGSAKNLVTVSNNTGTMHYKVNSGSWSTTLPQATNAGSWTIYWYMDESSNYNGIASASSRYVSSSIAKASGSVTTNPTAKSLIYNGTDQALVNAGSGTGTMLYSIIYTEPDGSKWIHVAHHNSPNSSGLFSSSDNFSSLVYKDSNRWFNVNSVVNGITTYEFMVKQRTTIDAAEVKYRWKQNKSPLTATYADVAPSAVTRVTTAGYTDGGYGGLYILNSSSYMVIANSTNGNWYGAFGAFSNYQGGIPGYPSTTITSGYMDLYVRVEDLSVSTIWYTSIPKETPAATYAVAYKASASTNYNESASGSVSVTIAKVTPTVTAPKACGLTYNGSAQNLVSGGSTNYGSLQYSTTSGGTYSTTIPQGTNATSYDVWYKVVGNSNVNSTNPAKVSVSIGKANPTYTAPKATTYTYNNTARALLSGGSTSHGTIKYSTDNSTWSTTVPTATNAGTYTAYWKLDGDSNHNNVGSTTVSSISISKVTPTVTAPTSKSLTYNGSPQALYNAGSTNWGTIQYCATSGGTYSTNMITATNAGSYDCWYKVVGNDNVNNVAAAKATGTAIGVLAGSISYATTAVTKTYGNAAFTNTLTKTGDGTVTYSSNNTTVATVNSNGQVTIKQAGSATITATVANTSNTTYATKTASYTLTVNKANGSVSTAPTAKSLTYNGSAQALVTAGSGTGTMLYKLGSGSWGTAIPSGTNATSYTVYYKASASTNYNESASGSVACSISKKTGCAISFATTAVTKTYGNAAFTNAITNTGDGSLTWGSSNTTIATVNSSGQVTIKQAGSCTISATTTSTTNCTYSTTAASYTLTVNKASISPTVTISNWTYGGTASNPSVAGNSGSGAVTYYYKLTSASSWSTTKPSTAGSYDIRADIAATTNYNSGSCTNTFTISPKTVSSPTITLSPSSYVWSNSECKPTPTVKDGSTTIASSEYTVSYSNNKAAGTATCTITDKSGGNYTVSGSKTFTISKYTPTAPTAKSLTYNTSAQALANAGSTSYGSIVYCSTSGGTFSTTIPTGTNAGSYEVWWKLSGDSTVTANCNNTAATKINCTITAKTVSSPTITLSQSTYTYSNSECKPTPTVKDGSTTISSSEYTVSYSNNTNVGTATCTITDKSGGNYTVSGSKTFTINCYSATAPTAKSLTYNTSAQALVNAGSTSYGTMVYCSTSSGTYSTTIPTRTNAGSYEVWWKVTGNTNVCNTAATKIDCEINKADPTYVAPTSLDNVYNGSAQDVFSSGAATGGTIIFIMGSQTATTSPQGTNAGDYSCQYYVKGDSNHNDTTAVQIYGQIVKAVPIVTSPTARNLTYNGSAQTLYTSGAATGGTIIFIMGSQTATTSPQGTNAGDYSCQYYVKGDSNHKDTVAGMLYGEIKKVTPTVSAPTRKNPTWNGSEQYLVNAGSTNWGTLQYSKDNSTWGIAIPKETEVGNYSVWYRVVGDSNINDVAAVKISNCLIKKIIPTMTTCPQAVPNLVYNGSPQTLGMGGVASTTGSFTYTTGTTAGTYSVTWSFTPTDTAHYDGLGYQTSTCPAITATIAKATRTVGIYPSDSAIAWGSTLNVSAVPSPTTETGNLTFTWTTSNSSIVSITGSGSSVTLTGLSGGSATITCTVSSTANYTSASISRIFTVDSYMGHDYVEIAGVKWATMNVGATSVTGLGKYFAWADISGYTSSQIGSGSGKKNFWFDDYKYCDGTQYPTVSNMTKYNNSDGKTIVEASDDAVKANWGGCWRLPTYDEMTSLLSNTNSAYTTNYNNSGVSGYVFTDKTDSTNKVFFPAAQYYSSGSKGAASDYGGYWISRINTVEKTQGMGLHFEGTRYPPQVSSYDRCIGLPIRGVASQ